MQVGARRCLVCDCEGSMRLDGAGLARALGGVEAAPVVHHQLCGAQLDRYREALGAGGPLLVACTQEAPLFGEVAGERGGADVAFTNVRERAGWSEEGAAALPKIAALLAEAAAAAEVPTPATLSLKSSGRCLVYGRDEVAVDAAKRLAGQGLEVTLLLVPGAEVKPPAVRDVPVLSGRLRRLTGHLGAFAAEVDGLAGMAPSSRARARFGAPAAEPETLEADLVVDLTGDVPLVTAPEKRDGYLRADPRSPAAVAGLLLAAGGLVGEFDKPRYVAFRPELCVHSRNRRTGCTRCLDQCPTGAITPAGNTVAIDPYVCAGCGSCSGVCPTGAATYAAPTPNALLERLRALLGGYLDAGGADPVLLLYEARHGDDLVDWSARAGRGLPARVLPFAVAELGQLGLEALAGGFAYGAASVVVLAPPRKEGELGGLRANLGYLGAVLDGQGYGAQRLVALSTEDPDEFEAALWLLPHHAPPVPAAYLPMGNKRALARQALDHLHAKAPTPAGVVPLPAGAPFGTLRIDVEGCTLCLACVQVCPTGALLDNPERPTLRFLEDACVQCGLCQNTCPERVIQLEPRLSFLPEAKSPRTVKEEEPAACVRCGKQFGTRGSIERVVAKLADKHPMFRDPAQIELMRMCDNCRVAAQFEGGANPFAAASRPRTRTTDDYLRERVDAELQGH